MRPRWWVREGGWVWTRWARIVIGIEDGLIQDRNMRGVWVP